MAWKKTFRDSEYTNLYIVGIWRPILVALLQTTRVFDRMQMVAFWNTSILLRFMLFYTRGYHTEDAYVITALSNSRNRVTLVRIERGLVHEIMG